MKRSSAAVAAACLCAALAFGLTGCNKNDNGGNGENNTQKCAHAAATYNGDKDSHWKECGDCGEKFDETPHAAYDAESRKDNAICPVCSYKFYTDGLRFGLGETNASIMYSKNVTDTEIYIPDTLYGLPVTGIFGAFEGYENITGVRIPDTVKDIGYSAFKGCKSLKEITLPEGLEHLGTEAFAGCASLESVTVPESVEDILNAFKGCTNLKSVNIPCNASEIYYGAFEGCESLEKIALPDTVTKIHAEAFKDCKNLKEIILPDGLEYIGKDAFAGCVSLEKINLPDSLNDLRSGIFKGCEKLILNESANGYYLGNEGNPHLVLMRVKDATAAEFTINTDCKFIYDGAFNGCANLAGIVINENIKGIGAGAFEGCTALASAEFANVKDWRHMTDSSSFGVLESDLRNVTTAAKYLAEDYVTHYWRRLD